jgi:glycosyl transferase family 2
MKILRAHPKKPKVSVIFLDWGVRESFHSLDYLDRQSVPRSEYEVIWVEFYDHLPQTLVRKVEESEVRGRPLIEQWIVVGAAREVYFHKHYAYNTGIALAQGEICVVCDSDAMFPENFIARILEAFDATPGIVLHIDQIRNANRAFYPFNYPDTAEVISDSLTINWNGHITRGLEPGADILHEANYGACMAAWRRDLLAIGGADEHIDYLGYICGPYDMTFRLVNFGRKEVWLDDIFLIHTWHPSEGGTDNLGGPQDGRGMSLRALEAHNSGRTAPLIESPAIAACRTGQQLSRPELIRTLEQTSFSNWNKDNSHLKRVELPRLVRENVGPFNIVQFDGRYYGFPQSCGPFFAEKATRGEYDCFHHDENLDRLIQRLHAAVGTQTIPAPAVDEKRELGLIAKNVVPLGRRAEKERIVASGLFDYDFYLRCNPDVAAAGVDPLDHFLEHGATENRNPNPLFDAQYYVREYSEVLETGVNPLTDFIIQGAFEGRRPNWLFDPDYYYRKNLDVAVAGANPLAHFLVFGAKEGRKPHPLFDTAFYLARNPDVAAAGVNPLSHYMQSGAAEGRQPCILFAPAYYLEHCRGDETAAANPLRHFIEIGAARNYDPHPLFDCDFYTSTVTVPVGMDPLAHFVDVGSRNAPSRLFDSRFYLSRYPDVAAAGLNPLVHFLLHGAQEGRWPNPLFNTAAYRSRHPELGDKGVNPLVHYVSVGTQEPISAPVLPKSVMSFDRRPLVPLSVIITCSGQLDSLKVTLEASRKYRGGCELEFILVGEAKAFGLLRDLNMPEVRWEMLDRGGRPRARNLGAQAARHDTLLFLEEGHEPGSEDLFGIHASRHAIFPGKNFTVVGKVEDNDNGGGRNWPPTESVGSSMVDYRFFNAGNVSMKKGAVCDWLKNGFRSEFTHGLEDMELAYRLASTQGLRLIYDPRATVIRSKPFELHDWMDHHRAIGRMLKLMLDMHPDAAASLGLTSTMEVQGSGVTLASGEEDIDYETVIKGLEDWLYMLHSKPTTEVTSWRSNLTAMLLEICRTQGFLSALPHSRTSAAIKRQLLDRFVELFRQNLHLELVDQLPIRLAGAVAASS